MIMTNGIEVIMTNGIEGKIWGAHSNKYVCMYSEEIYANGKLINISKDRIYIILANPYIEYYELFSEDKSFIGEVLGKIGDHFITIAEYRQQRINEIFND